MSGTTESGRVDIYVLGVGGQGIGLLVEAMMRAADHAGCTVKGVDTHGLAQRGGTVVSCLRIGRGANSPMIAPGRADAVVALESNEAARGMRDFLRPRGTVVYYDTELQPLAVRLGRSSGLAPGAIERSAALLDARVIRVADENLPDSRTQNMAVLGAVCGIGIIPGAGVHDFESALADLLDGPNLEMNLKIFRDHSVSS